MYIYKALEFCFLYLGNKRYEMYTPWLLVFLDSEELPELVFNLLWAAVTATAASVHFHYRIGFGSHWKTVLADTTPETLVGSG